MFLPASLVENLTINPRACGWKRLEPKLPRITNRIKSGRVFVIGANDIKMAVNNSPQKINILFRRLSAKNPKIGCKSDEQICDMLKTTVAIAMLMLSLAAMKGIIGLSMPV